MASGNQWKPFLLLIISAYIFLTTVTVSTVEVYSPASIVWEPYLLLARRPHNRCGTIYFNKHLKKFFLIEAFFDPVCPDSRDAWLPLRQTLNHYGDRLSLILHPFPLPYHDNSFLTSRVLHVVHNLKPSETFRVLHLLVEDQELFYNGETRNLSRDEAVNRVVNLFGNAGWNMSDIRSGLNDSKTDLLTRVSFKNGCLRGVFGTPTFFVNGFPLLDSPLDHDGWRKIIDPLLNSLNKVKEDSLLH